MTVTSFKYLGSVITDEGSKSEILSRIAQTDSSIGDWFQTTVGVRQGFLLSPTLFNIFLERIVTDSFEDQEGTVNN